MADPFAVTNTTPVIALTRIGELRLFEQLFPRVLVPLGVWAEIAAKSEAPEIDKLRSLSNIQVLPSPPPPPEAVHLGSGECAAMALALSVPGSLVLLDDFAARVVAESLHLPVRGTLGILVEARRRSLIPAVKPFIEQLRANGQRISDGVARVVLAGVDESL